VLVAIGIDLEDDFVIGEGEAGPGGIPWLKEGEPAAFGGEEEDPFDVVIGIHRVDDLADLDVDPALGFDEGGDVLLLGGVDFVGPQLFHRFAAANRSGAEVVEFGDDRTAM